MDGSHPDPEGQLSAVREVFAEIGAAGVREMVVINKADAADPMVLARLRQREPHSVVVSARTGEGIAEALALIEGELPRPGVEFRALLPYERGDLVNRIHQQGEIASMEHTGEGTLVAGRAHADLADEPRRSTPSAEDPRLRARIPACAIPSPAGPRTPCRPGCWPSSATRDRCRRRSWWTGSQVSRTTIAVEVARLAEIGLAQEVGPPPRAVVGAPR